MLLHCVTVGNNGLTFLTVFESYWVPFLSVDIMPFYHFSDT